MPYLAPTTRERLLKYLRNQGFTGPYSIGKHQFMIKGELRLGTPNPEHKEIGVELLRRILKQAGITVE